MPKKYHVVILLIVFLLVALVILKANYTQAPATPPENGDNPVQEAEIPREVDLEDPAIDFEEDLDDFGADLDEAEAFDEESLDVEGIDDNIF